MAKKPIETDNGKTKTKVVTYNTDPSNLAGVNYQQQSVGSPKATQATKSNVLSGTPSTTKETGKTFVPSTPKATDTSTVKQNAQKYQPTLSSVADSSNKSAQKLLNQIGSIPDKIENTLKKYLTTQGVDSMDDNAYKSFSQKLDSNFANDGTIGSSFLTTDSMAKEMGRQADQRISTEKLLSGQESKGYNMPKEERDSMGGVVVDKRTGRQADANYVNGLYESVTAGRDEINATIESLNRDYQDGKISADDYVKLYEEQTKKWGALQKNADELLNYDYKSGKDYYDWLKENGTEDEVRSFEEYVSSFDDSMLESLVNSYKATLVDFNNRIPQLYDMIRAYNDSEYDFNDPSHLSNQMRGVAEELRSYTLNGKNDQGIRRYALQTISSLMPMINDAIVATVTGGALGIANVQGFASGFTNIEMGIGSAAETMRKRLEEGNTVESSFWNAVAHGTITGAVEAFNVGNVMNIVNLFTGAGTNVLGTGLLALPNFGQMLMNMAKDGAGEAFEEWAEYAADYFIDSLSNAIFGTNFSVDKTPFRPFTQPEAYGGIGEGGLTDQMIMAYGGAFILGIPTNVALTIDSVQKYNAAGEAIKYWKNAEAYYNSQNDVENAQMSRAIADFIQSERQPFAQSSQTAFAVEFESDIPTPAPTIDDTMNIVANAFKLDVDDQFMAYEQNMEQMNQLANTLEDSMAQRGINMSLNDYVELSPEERTEYKKLSNFFNENGISNGFARLMPGQNGMSVADGVILNTDQSRTIDIDALADLDRAAYRNAMATDRNEIFKEAGAEASATTSAAHEITHYAERSGLWNSLRDMVRDMMGEERFNTAVNRLKAIYAQRGVYDADAEHEAVAFFIQKNLGNEQFLRSLTAYNDSLANRLLSSIKSLFSNDVSYQLEQTFKKAMKDSIDIAVKEAQALYKNGRSGYVGDNYVSPTMAQLSVASYKTTGRAILKNYLKNSGMSKKSQNELLDRMEETYKAITKFMETGKFPEFSKWQDTTYDIDKDGNFSIVISNGDYDLNIDFSTVCKKRKMMDKVLNELSRQGYLNSALKPTQLTQMRQIIQEHGLEVACGLCFVDAKRFNQGAWAGKFETKWNGLVDQLAGLTDLDEEQIATFGNGSYDATPELMNIDFNDPIYSSFVELSKGSTEEAKMAKALVNDPELRAYVSTNSMYGSEGFEELKQYKPKLYDLANASGGASKPKLAHTEVLYDYSIENSKNFNAEDAQKVGGVRLQSFSDFMTNMVFDYVQMFGDMEAKKLTGHSYTKVKEYALLFGKTGMKINLSIIPAGFDSNVYTAEQIKDIHKNDKALWRKLRENAGLDADGNYIFDKESFDWELALEIQNLDGYDANVGTICVGVSDKHILKMLNDPDVCMVIPYHRSGINPTVADMMGIGVFNDYTLKQNTRFRKSNGRAGTKVGKAFDFDFYNGFTTESGEHYKGLIENKYNAKKTANEYLRFCEDSGYIPKFDAFMDHPNYYKLLIDFRAYDKNGKVAPQKAIKISGDGLSMDSNYIDPTLNPALAKIYGDDIGFNNVLQKGLEVYEETEAYQNEQLDPIAQETVEKLGLKKQYSLGEDNRYHTGNKTVDEMMNNIVDSMSPEEFENYLKTGEFEYATREEVFDDPEIQDEGLWVKDPEGSYINIDDNYISDGKTVAWKDERIDELINAIENNEFDYFDSRYKNLYALNLSPREYRALSFIFEPVHNTVWNNDIKNDPEYYNNGEVNPDNLGGPAWRQVDYMFFRADAKDGVNLKIVGQEGNHRAIILDESGYSKMPILLATNKPIKGTEVLNGMDVNTTEPTRNPNKKLITSNDYVEINRENRDRLIEKFGSGSNADIQYSLSEEVEEIKAKNKKSHSKKDALILRDAGEKLSEPDFYKVYSAHILNLRGNDNLQEQIEDIKANGFKGDAGFGINVMPSSINNGVKEWTEESYNKYRNDLREQYGFEPGEKTPWEELKENPWKGGMFIDESFYHPVNMSQLEYGVKKGQTVLFVPESWVEDGRSVKNGYKPFDYEIVTADRNFQPYYELYEKAYDESHPDVQYALGEEFEQQNPREYYEYGMNPVRDTDILRETEEGPTRRHVNNMANSAWVSDEEAQRLQKAVEDGDYAYQPVAFKEVDNQAKETLKKKGLQESYKEVIDTKDITLEKIALARQVLNQLRIDGKEGTPEYEKLQRVNARFYTPSAQMLAYARWLRQSTPDGQIITIESEIERMQEELQNRWGDRAPKLEIPEDLRSEYVNPNTKEERRQEIREEIAQQIADQIPPSVLEQLNSFRHLAMLFNPKTWIKNNLSNMAFGYVNEATRAMRSVLETIAKNYGDTHSKSIFAGMEREAGAYNPLSKKDTTLYKEFEQDYLNNYKNNISKYSNMDIGEMLASSEFGDLVQGKRKQFTSDFLNALSEINAGESKNRIFKYFGLSDTPAMKKAYAKSMVGYFKAKNLDINNVTEEQMQKAREFAYKEALYATFNTNNWLANQITKFERNADKAGHGAIARMVVESFIPFKRTPLNLIKTGYNYTPLGLATSLARDLTMVKKGQMTANQLINHMAQGLTGSSLFALGMLLANLGLFRTKDEDKDRKKYFDQENGEQDYALVFDGGTYTIDWLDPMIVPIAMGAEAFKAFGENDGLSLENLINIAASVADPMFETSMLSGISKNLSGFETNSTQWWGQIAKNAITTYASQYVPSMLGATARTVDDTRRSSYTDKKGLEKFGRQTLNKIPYFSKYSEPYINKQGEEEKNEDLGMGVAGRAILNFLSPGYYSSKDIDKYDEELYRLYDAEGDIGVLPSSTSKSLTYNKEDYKFTAKEYTEWHKTRYKTEAKYVDQFMDSNAYKNLSDQEKIDTIKDIRSYAQKVAKKQFLESKGYVYTDNKELAEKEPEKYVYDKELTNTKTVMDDGVELYQYYDYLNNAGTKQADKLKYLEESGFSEKQKKALYGLSGYKTSYEDAYAKAMGEKTSTKKNSSSKKKSSSSSSKKSSSKVSKGSVSSAPKAKKGSVSMNKVSSAPNAKLDTQKLANNYLKAYSNTMSKSKASQTGSSVVCPRCRNRVTPYNGKCPVCGNNL